MISRLFIFLSCAFLGASSLAADAQAFRIKLRAVLHDPANPAAEFHVQGAAGSVQRLNLSLEGIGEAQEVTVVDGTLRLYSTAQVDPAKPLENLAASVKVPPNVKKAIAFIVPSGGQPGQPYRMLLFDDSPTAFPMGESRVINLSQQELAVRAGEHRKVVKPASIETLPRVTKLNDMNQAPTQFYQKSGAEWTLLSERPTQFTDSLRNIFLLYTMPNVPEAQVRTLIDTQSAQP
jgi:hypothetical protein